MKTVAMFGKTLRGIKHTLILFSGHNAKISLVLFHRAVSDLLVTAAFDGELLFWDLDQPEAPLGRLVASGPLLALSWSPDGSKLAGLDETGRVCVWPEPRTEAQRQITCETPVTSPRGGRLVWCQKGILTSGFRGNKRLMTSLHVEADAVVIVGEIEIESTSPAVLTLSADVDKGLVLAVGRVS